MAQQGRRLSPQNMHLHTEPTVSPLTSALVPFRNTPPSRGLGAGRHGIIVGVQPYPHHFSPGCWEAGRKASLTWVPHICPPGLGLSGPVLLCWLLMEERGGIQGSWLPSICSRGITLGASL